MPTNDLKLAQKYLSKAQSSEKRGIEFALSLQSYINLQRAKKCYYTGTTLTNTPNKPNSKTIDRIDSSRGYVKGNVVACAAKINSLKNSWECLGMNESDVLQVINKKRKRVS